MALVINAPRIFSGLWSWIKRFVDPNTVAKVRFVSTGPQLRATLEELFPPELARWLEVEIDRNSKATLEPTQQLWWQAPPAGETHDPRGCASYVARYLQPGQPPSELSARGNHRPHPSIRLATWPRSFVRLPDPPPHCMKCSDAKSSRKSPRKEGGEVDGGGSPKQEWTV